MLPMEYLSGKQFLWIVNNGVDQSPLRKGNTVIDISPRVTKGMA